MMNETISLISRYHEALLGGALKTLQLAGIAWAGGLVLGTLLGIWRASHTRGSKGSSITLFSAVASSIPVLVYLMWCHYPLQSALGISVRPFITAAAVFTFYNALTIGETVRGAVGDLPLAFS